VNVVTFTFWLAVVSFLVELHNICFNQGALIDDFGVNTHKHGLPLGFKVDFELVIDILSAYLASFTDVGQLILCELPIGNEASNDSTDVGLS